ncbi:putative reverse transcriptase domain-containing protein [Tanacetum coccineum]
MIREALAPGREEESHMSNICTPYSKVSLDNLCCETTRWETALLSCILCKRKDAIGPTINQVLLNVDRQTGCSGNGRKGSRLICSFWMTGVHVDGMDVLSYRKVAMGAIDVLELVMGSTLVECATYRFRGYSLVDPGELRDPGKILDSKKVGQFKYSFIQILCNCETYECGIAGKPVSEADGEYVSANSVPFYEDNKLLGMTMSEFSPYYVFFAHFLVWINTLWFSSRDNDQLLEHSQHCFKMNSRGKTGWLFRSLPVGLAVIDCCKPQRKRGKYMAKCAAIGYGFIPFSFSSLGELEADEVTLLKRIRKFSMAQDIEARAAVHIFNRILLLKWWGPR